MKGTKDNRYGNVDELLSGEGSDAVPARRRRPRAPAIDAMRGENKPLKAIEVVTQEKESLEEQLKVQRDDAATKITRLEKQLKSQRGNENPISLVMPVTKQRVSFELTLLDPTLIDVSPENERIQSFLDAISLQDILPSIKKQGQQKPGTVRPIAGGRFELIEGSRRLAAVKLAGAQYLALVGAVPDADVRELSVIENKHQDVSAYEKARAYDNQIKSGDYDNWTQLGAAKGISSSHISRYKLCVELDEIFVRILPSPSDMPLSYGETISALMKKGAKELLAQAEKLLLARQGASDDGSSLVDAEGIIKLLKSAVRNKLKKPTAKKPVEYKTKNGDVCLKHSLTNKGTSKFELVGADQAQVEKVLTFLKAALKVNT